MEKDSCYGCIDFYTCSIRNEPIRGLTLEERITDCPCSSCLIKIMCHNQCEKFSLHCEKIYALDNYEFLRGDNKNGTKNKK